MTHVTISLSQYTPNISFLYYPNISLGTLIILVIKYLILFYMIPSCILYFISLISLHLSPILPPWNRNQSVIFETLGICFKNEFNWSVFRTAIYGCVYCSLYEGTTEEIGRPELELTVYHTVCPCREHLLWVGGSFFP